MKKSNLLRRNTTKKVSRNIGAKSDVGNESQNSSKYKLLPGTQRRYEFEAPDKDFDIYTITPISAGVAAWVCCKTSKIVTLVDKVGTVLREVEYPVLINGLDIAYDTGNLWSSGAGGRIMELTQSTEPVLRFSVGNTILCLCVTQNNHIIIGMSGKLVMYDFTGNVLLTSDITNDVLLDSELATTDPALAGSTILTETAKAVSALDIFLTACTGTLKPKSKQTVFNMHSSTDDEKVESKSDQSPKNAHRKEFLEICPEEISSVVKIELELGGTVSELHATSNTEKNNMENTKRSENNTEKHARSVVCTPHVVRECLVTNNIAVVDLNLVIHGGDGGRPFILILNSQFKKEHQCVFPVRYLINDLAYDNAGNIVVSDSFGSVFLLSGVGLFLRKIFTPDATVKPYVLGVDKETNRLWAVFKDFRDRSNVKVLRYCKGGRYTKSYIRYSNSKTYISTRL